MSANIMRILVAAALAVGLVAGSAVALTTEHDFTTEHGSIQAGWACCSMR